MQTNIDITQAFMDVPDGVLSIHQLSQKLKLPYGTSYNRVHQLNEQNIIQILPKGKAKLCALNPDNQMTANLLALGGAQSTENFIAHLDSDGEDFVRKLIKLIKAKTKGKISSAVLISPNALKEVCSEESPESKLSAQKAPEYQQTIDLFFIKSDEQFDESLLENEVSAMLPTSWCTSITSIVVDKETILGMLGEEENEAGLAAYTMLHDGIILYGYESFYEIILEAFTKKLTSIS